MDINTHGFKSSEFWLTAMAIVGVAGVAFSDKLGVTLDAETKQDIILYLLGIAGLYTGGRSAYKMSKVKAMAAIEVAKTAVGNGTGTNGK